MNDIRMFKDGKFIVVTSKKLGVSDFGNNKEQAKRMFKRAVNLMLDTKLKDLKITQSKSNTNKRGKHG